MNNEQTREWLKKANDDYTCAAALMEKIFPPQVRIVCHDCQQCAEKALKAFCVENNVAFTKTHDLTILCNLCMTKNPNFSSLLNDCGILTPYSTQTRYPSTMQILEPDAKTAIKMAKKILDFAQEKILKKTYKENTVCNWYIEGDKTNAVLIGNFFNRNGFPDGHNGKTSRIRSVTINEQEKEYEIQTQNTLYHCSFDSINFEEQDKSSFALPDYERIKNEYGQPVPCSTPPVTPSKGGHGEIGS